MMIRVEPLTRAGFAEFGDVLELEGRAPRRINNGLTLKFGDLSRVALDPAGQAQLCVYRSDPVSLPFPLVELERHPLASQAFVPLHGRPFPVVVAHSVAAPSARDLRAFLTNGRQGVNLKPGIWHHHQLSLDERCDYLVVERLGDSGNLELCRITGEAVLHV